MNIHGFDKKLHNGRLFGTLRRVVAGALTAAMLLPMVPTFGANNEIKLQPIQDETYRPDIEIQSNFVRDDFGFLTGYMELGLRVKTGGEPFRYLAVSLEYDTELYTPVDWSATADEIKIRNMPTDTPKLPYDYYSEELPAQKEEHINFVRAYTGIPDTPAADLPNAALTPEVKSGRHALVSFWASATDRLTDDENDSVDGVVFKEMTTIAVIRFKVNEDELENFTIKKNSDGTGYDIFYKDEKVTNVVELQTEMNKPAANKWGKSVEFADDADIYVTEPDTELALEYRAGSVRLDATGNPDKVNGTLYERRYYYLPGYDAAQNVKVNLVREGKTYANVDKPNYLNLLDPAVKVPSKVGDADRFSYLTNLIVDKTGSADPKDDHYYVTFPVVSERSFMAGEDILDKLTTIVYVDWDNTLLGTQIVPQNTDVRGLVSDYVAENFIYHDTIDTAYGDNDSNNPLALTAANPNDLTPAEAAVKSLERKYNYRGKYPADGPAADNTTSPTTVDDKTATNSDGDRILPLGAEYPLTNKLDYVFFKRPMGHDAATKPDPTTYPGGSTDPQYLADKATWENTWIQPSTYNAASNAYTIEYDVERPFAYGWAKCTQANFEDVWTTMGMGELASYSGSTNGGYLAQTAGATVTVDGEAGSQLVFADLKTGFKTGEKTVFLKAVYEPGTELLTSDSRYRMISEPYYNKLNDKSAADGGAYSVDVTFERATAVNFDDPTDDSVRGVARIREPEVRQDTTVDLLWETFEKDGTLVIDHNLPSANLEDTYSNKNKSIFSRVVVDNKDVVPFSLTLTGRQNKADYYLKDAYGYNFVAGGDRVDGDATRSGTAATMDNYNYFVDGENESGPVYAAVPYATREGSRGFVLSGTLNQLMQLATRCYRGEMTQAEFNPYADIGVFNDINIKAADGADPGLANRAALRQAVLDVAKEIAINHQGDPDYWDNVHDCAQLTYHQLQLYIMGQGPKTRAAADAITIGHCHLHTKCVASVSNKPTTWAQLLDAARNNPNYITELTGTEAETLTHLRKDGNGAAYGADVTGFKDAVVAAVTALDAAAPAAAGDKYWWYDGSTSVTLNSWADLLAAAKDSITAVTLPDGSTATRDAKLNRVENAWTANDGATTTDPTWVRITENLCITVGMDEGQKFASSAAFKTALKDALTVAKNAGVTAPTWNQVQYHVLHSTEGGYAFPVTPSTAQEAEFATYWWHNGGFRVVDLATLLMAADSANQGDSTALDAFTVADLYNTSYTDLHFRSAFGGAQYTAADLDNLKAAVKTLVASEGTSLSWNQVQYATIHGSISGVSNGVIQAEANSYYWWKNDGAPTAMTFSGDRDTLLGQLLEAAYRSALNGNTHAWDNLTTTEIQGARLIQTDNSGQNFSDLGHFSTGDFQTAMEALVPLAGGKAGGPGQAATLPTATWEQVQYYLIHNSFITSPDSTQQAEMDGYWWKTKDSQTMSGSQYYGQMQTALQDSFDQGGGDVSQIEAWCTAENLNGAGFVSSAGAAFDDTTASDLVNNGVWWSFDLWSFPDAASVSWYEMQFFLLNGYNSYMSDADIADDLSNNWGITPPSWVPAPTALLSLRAMKLSPTAAVRETTLSEDGFTEITKTTIKTPDAMTIVTTAVTRVPNGETTTVITTTTTVTTTIDEETGEPVTTSDTKTTVTEELVTPETPLAPIPDDPYTITPDTDVIETDEPTEPPAESTVTPEETPEPGAGDKTEPTEDEEGAVGAGSKPTQSTTPDEDDPGADSSTPPVGADGTDAAGVGSKPAQSANPNREDDPGADGPTTDPPETDETSTDPPDPGGGETKTLALARARLRLKPLSLISLRRTKAPPPLISIFTPNSSAGRALL